MIVSEALEAGIFFAAKNKTIVYGGTHLIEDCVFKLIEATLLLADNMQ